MRETLSMTLLLGWLGNLLYPSVKKDMDTMFDYRHRATQRYFLDT